MKRVVLVAFLCMAAIYCSACGGPTQVLKQDIPVSTNPMGAQIYVDGTPTGVTPTTISLERDKDHIVTLTKENYRQADVTVKRKYKETSLVDAINSGVRAGLFHGDVTMGVSNSLGSMSSKEKTGEMFTLIPSVIKVELAPMSGAPASTSSSTMVTPASTAQPAATQPGQPEESGSPELDKGALAKDLLKIGVAAGASQLKPIEHKETLSSSSSSNTYQKSDGSVVTEKKSSKTSVGVSFNPAGALDLLDKLLK
jgi:hypothetical protein